MSIAFTATQTIRLYLACEDSHSTFPGASEDALEIRSLLYTFKRKYDDYRRGNCKLAVVRKHHNKLTKCLDAFSPAELVSYGGTTSV